MVDNPEFHSQGDFVLHDDGILYPRDDSHGRALTFGNIGLYDMRQFEDIESGEKVAMSPYYRAAIERGHATGAYFHGVWENVGTPEQLAQLNEKLS
jgi:MurNAc alpha-1-phosphate uridylyltransferase